MHLLTRVLHHLERLEALELKNMNTINDIAQKVTDGNTKADQLAAKLAAFIASNPTQAQLDAVGAGLDQLLGKIDSAAATLPAPQP